MASSQVPLSLLAKGIGQLSKNGHERLDVYLEPEDYYNLESKYQRYQLQALRREAARTDVSDHASNGHPSLPMHKTFLTRKGALLLFSEELAKKALEEERNKKESKLLKEHELTAQKLLEEAQDKADSKAEPIRTCNDLSWAILSYGHKPDYRRKGHELYLRFVHEHKTNLPGRRIRPGFSPKRYISTWSKYWDEGMLQKLRSGGMISDKTLYRQNPLLPHLYKYATYNLSAVPPPYRVTKSMLMAPGNVPSYEFYRAKAHPGSVVSVESASRAPPPSQLEPSYPDDGPLGAIQAVKYHESGEIQEVTYSDLRPQEKQEILAELLIAAHEHQQHIRDTLELVMSNKREREGSERGRSSSGASELMADMQRAILSLVESPVRQQVRDRQRLLEEHETKLQEQKRLQELKEEKRQQKREERKAKKAAEKAQAKKAAEEAAAKKAAERAAQKAAQKAAKLKEKTPPDQRKAEKKKPASPDPPEKITAEDPKEEERRLKEERRKKRREERENRRRLREEKLLQEEETAKEREAARLVAEAEASQRPPSRDEQRHDDDHRRRRHRRHRHHDGDADEEEEDKLHRRDRKSRRKSEKETEQSRQVPPAAHHVTTSEASGHVRQDNEHPDQYALAPSDGVTEIKHVKEKRPKLQRRNAGMEQGVPTQVPTNTPAVDMRALARPQGRETIEYDEVILLEPHKSLRRRSHASSVDGSRNAPTPRVHKDSQDTVQHPAGPISVTSSHSSAAKQVVFAPELPGDDASSHKPSGGSFYGGRMPITSNLVKQTLSDKVSILSASQDSGSVHESGNYSSPKQKSEPLSVAKKSYKSSEDKASENIASGVYSVVPSIGIEPATPLNVNQKSASPFQQSTPSSQHTVPATRFLKPSGSTTSSHRSLGGRSRSQKGDQDSGEGKEDSLGGSDGGESSKKLPSKGSDSENDDSDNNDDTSQPSQMSDKKSSKRSVASKSSQTTSTKSKKSKLASFISDETLSTSTKSWMSKKDSPVEPAYAGLKGIKGPGSQSSSSNLKSSTTKKSRSTRGSVPSAMKRGGHGINASVTMPGGEVVSVGGSLVRPDGDAIVESESEETESVTFKAPSEELESDHPTLAKPSIKSSVHSASADRTSSVKSGRRVSFQDLEPASQTEDEDEDKMSSNMETDYDVTEGESANEDEEWPAVKEDEVTSQGASSASRPISSRSEKLTAHAQKVAAIVVKKHRPGSGLDEDAKQAADLWNKALDTEDEEESEESSEEEEEWGVTKQPSSVSDGSKGTRSQKSKSSKSSEDEKEKKRKERLQKILKEKKQEKELRPSMSSTSKVPSPKKEISVPDSISSAPSTVSSAQESFVNEMQRKASDLGIEAKDLEFQADVVDKLAKSDITPDDVEVVHDVESGRHVVRSRRSSTTVSSDLTPYSDDAKKETPRDKQPKQKLVVDLNLDKQSSISPSRRSSVTSSMSSSSPVSQPHSARSSVSQRRSSIPVDKGDVQLDFDVTTYESKLGDPKPEEPIIQSGKPHIEPEKIKAKDSKTSKLNEKAKPNLASKVGGAESVHSSQASTNKPATTKQQVAKTKQKQPAGPTKGPLRKGQVANLKAEEAKSEASSVVESDDLTEEEKLQKDLAKITEAQKSVAKKSDLKKKKAVKGKPKAGESVVSDVEARKPTPEKLSTKTPETPFRAGQAKEAKPLYDDAGHSPDDTGKQESIASLAKSKKSDKTAKKQKKKKEAVVTQVEVDTPKVEQPAPTPPKKLRDESRPTRSSAKKSEPDADEAEDDFEEYVPAESPEDNYEFVRREDTPDPTPEPAPSPPKSSPKPEDTKSQVSEATEMTEATERSSQAAAQAAEDEAEREAKLAAKQERDQKRAAAAEKRRLEVERKRKEKEEQIRKEKEEQERQEQMKEELEAERRKREEAARMRKVEAERAKQREKEEEEQRQRRLLQEQERDRKQKEEYRRKMEELQRRKKEEEERKRELARIAAAEEAERKREEEELMAQMAEDERIAYAEQKRIQEEERKKQEEERRAREEAEAKIRMEKALNEARERAKEAKELEEKLRFIREFFTEANGMDQTQNVNRSFTFSYFELMRMLGLDVVID